ncbi:BolA family protein [Kushneria phyllosphaerae]|uniref:Acid stress protein IbaG n=1 Tax=Kushneria phyllosphaerae TaxID=2100822 RepID=A0A2R8CQA2_9GAMM|nr:BolA/IbaG family iron-sulfur metabolism protein [Kushneria phyllosphaerae]SPJ35076.1 Acid stress protein IbaG [Kushneria phyllosphaerae]
MQPDEVKRLLEARIESCEFEVQGEGCNFQVTAIGDVFEGMTPVKRQQLIYAALSEEIASGALHAISIRTMTPAQRAAASPDSDRA